MDEAAIKSARGKIPSIAYSISKSTCLHPVVMELMERTRQLPNSIMMASPDSLSFLRLILDAIGAKHVLDIGVYTGLSALTSASAIPDDGRVVALDVCKEDADIGLPFWQKAGLAHKIDLRIGLAAETLKQLIADGKEGTFDLAFIDADKPSYMEYYELSLRLLRRKGIILIDNTLWFGRVFDPTVNDPSTEAIRRLNDKIRKDPRVIVSMHWIGDGTSVVVKL